MNKHVCAHCGAESDESFIFCCNCGEMIEEDNFYEENNEEVHQKKIEETVPVENVSEEAKRMNGISQHDYNFTRTNMLQFMLGMLFVILRDTISGAITALIITVSSYDDILSYQGIGTVVLLDRYSDSYWCQIFCSFIIAVIGVFLIFFAIDGMFVNRK